MPFSIVRYGAPTDSLTPAGNVAVTPAGETSKSAPLSRTQVRYLRICHQWVLPCSILAQLQAVGRSAVIAS